MLKKMFEPLLAFFQLIRGWHVFLVVGCALAFAIWGYFATAGDLPSAVRLEFSVHAIIMLPVMVMLLAFMTFLFRHSEFGAAASFPSVAIVWAGCSILAVIGFGIGEPAFPYIPIGTMMLVGSLIMSAMICGWLALVR